MRGTLDVRLLLRHFHWRIAVTWLVLLGNTLWAFVPLFIVAAGQRATRRLTRQSALRQALAAASALAGSATVIRDSAVARPAWFSL